MKKYWLYFKYIVEHKKNVFLECRKVKGMFWHGVVHDLSKFLPSEFIPYARKFYGEKSCKICEFYLDCNHNQIGLGAGKWAEQCIDYSCLGFNKAWKHHYRNNKHHWNYWAGQNMPEKYIEQMIIDWKAMSRKFGDTAQEFYMKNYDKIRLTHTSRVLLEFNLGLIDSVCLISNVNWKNYLDRIGKTMEEDLRELGYIK